MGEMISSLKSERSNCEEFWQSHETASNVIFPQYKNVTLSSLESLHLYISDKSHMSCLSLCQLFLTFLASDPSVRFFIFMSDEQRNFIFSNFYDN